MSPSWQRLAASLSAMSVTIIVAAHCTAKPDAISLNPGAATMKLEVTSPEFKEGEFIPTLYTADGKNMSPPLNWSAAPKETQSIALINEDPDAPVGNWVHWVVWDLPPAATALQEAVPAQELLADGTKQGTNSFGKIGYGGPSPPPGKPHRYYFKLYALDAKLNLKPGATKEQLVAAIGDHVIAQGELMGKYSR